jgi:dimethylaniline monooxygenase (N-oxide forming)
LKYPPLDCIIMNFATHAWESEWARRVGLHWFITTKISRLGFLLSTGTTWGFNQWGGFRYNMTWDQGRKHIVNKSPRCMALINRRIKRRSRFGWLYAWWDTAEPDALDVDLVQGPVHHVSSDAVYFEQKSGITKVEADVVVLATGYRQRFPFLYEHRKDGKDDPLPSEHFVCCPDEPRLAFFGFVRPNVGAIPPMSELQAMWWCEKLAGRVQRSGRTDYRLQEHKLDYAVDYGTYMFVLAAEIDAAPSLRSLVSKPKQLAACAFGQAHVPIFRLLGPFASADCEDVVETELFQVLFRRPFMMNLIFVLEALGFATINGAVLGLGAARSLLAR